jgi:hypothetical protein
MADPILAIVIPLGGNIPGLTPGYPLPGAPGHPSGGFPIAPGHPSGGFPVAPALPGHDLPWAPARPGHDLPGGSFPPSPTDPEWGVGAPPHPWLPGYVDLKPGHPDNALPPVASTKPPADPPPGTVWPPLPEGAPVGKCALIAWIPGVGRRYVVVDIAATPPATPKIK